MTTKSVLITGGSRGIGAATVKLFADKGYKVAFLYNKSQTEAAKLEKETGAVSIKCDVSNYEQVIQSIKAAKVNLGISCFDVLVCNAGISKIQLFADMTMEEWKQMVDINLNGYIYAVKAVLAEMIERKSGSIIMVSSMWGQVGASCEVAYSTVKAGVIGLVKSLAKEVGPSGIRVNCVAPGVINTDMNSEVSAETIEEMKEEIPEGRTGEPEEVANVIYFLAGNQASYVTGQVIGVNGGLIC